MSQGGAALVHTVITPAGFACGCQHLQETARMPVERHQVSFSANESGAPIAGPPSLSRRSRTLSFPHPGCWGPARMMVSLFMPGPLQAIDSSNACAFNEKLMANAA